MKYIREVKLLSIICALILTSCVTEKQIAITSKVTKEAVFAEIVPLVKFDPYTAKVYFDEYQVESKIQSIRSKAIANGGCDFKVKTVLCKYVGSDLNSDLWWGDMCGQLLNRGWGITQRDYTKGALNHGEYTVPCELLLNVYYGFGKAATRRFHFDVTNQDLSTSKNTSTSKPGRIGINYVKSTQDNWTNNKLLVTNVVANAPADKAGLKVNDVITHINNLAVDNLSLDQALEMTRGNVGESVTLTVIPNGQVAPHDVTMIRVDASALNAAKPSTDNSVLPTNSPKTDTTPVEKLKQLKELFDNGLITKDEYDLKRKEILNGL